MNDITKYLNEKISINHCISFFYTEEIKYTPPVDNKQKISLLVKTRMHSYLVTARSESIVPSPS